jgi:hypothetical protein
MIKSIDCEYNGYDDASKKFHVHEQLYPEARGFIVHEFNSEKEALDWLNSLDTV